MIQALTGYSVPGNLFLFTFCICTLKLLADDDIPLEKVALFAVGKNYKWTFSYWPEWPLATAKPHCACFKFESQDYVVCLMNKRHLYIHIPQWVHNIFSVANQVSKSAFNRSNLCTKVRDAVVGKTSVLPWFNWIERGSAPHWYGKLPACGSRDGAPEGYVSPSWTWL